jgi:hypothetical protein
MHPRLFDSAPLGTGNARDVPLGNARAIGLLVGFTEPLRRRRARRPAPVCRRLRKEPRASTSHRGAARIVAPAPMLTMTTAQDDDTKPMRARHRI